MLLKEFACFFMTIIMMESVAYKFLSRVIPNCSTFLAPLESLVAGKASSDILQWTDDLTEAFHDSQSHLHDNRSITIPRPDDQLWIVTDGAEKLPGIGSTLYVQRNGSLKVERTTDFMDSMRNRSVMNCCIPPSLQSLHHPV